MWHLVHEVLFGLRTKGEPGKLLFQHLFEYTYCVFDAFQHNLPINTSTHSGVHGITCLFTHTHTLINHSSMLLSNIISCRVQCEALLHKVRVKVSALKKIKIKIKQFWEEINSKHFWQRMPCLCLWWWKIVLVMIILQTSLTHSPTHSCSHPPIGS